MESRPQNPEFRNNPENFHPCVCTFGCAIPKASNSSGCFTGSSMTSLISLICLSKPPTISYVESGTFSTIIKLTSGSTWRKQASLSINFNPKSKLSMVLCSINQKFIKVEKKSNAIIHLFEKKISWWDDTPHTHTFWNQNRCTSR